MSTDRKKKNYKLRQSRYSKNTPQKGQKKNISRKNAQKAKKSVKPSVKVSFLGGLNEIGKNQLVQGRYGA